MSVLDWVLMLWKSRRSTQPRRSGGGWTMTLEDALRQVACDGCADEDPCLCWSSEGEGREYSGGSDGPSWRIESRGVAGRYTVVRSQGWYLQEGDANDADGVVVLAAAMDAAAHTLVRKLIEAEDA